MHPFPILVLLCAVDTYFSFANITNKVILYYEMNERLARVGGARFSEPNENMKYRLSSALYRL